MVLCGLQTGRIMASAFQCDRCKICTTSFCNKCKITVECGFTNDSVEFDFCDDCLKIIGPGSKGCIASILRKVKKDVLPTELKK